MVAWSELARAISTESIPSTIAINKSLIGACIRQMRLPCSHASLCRQLNFGQLCQTRQTIQSYPSCRHPAGAFQEQV